MVNLLAPGGILILNEITKETAFLNITFGLTPGWWRFQGNDSIRTDYPLLNSQQWTSLLISFGLEKINIYDILDQQHIFVFRKKNTSQSERFQIETLGYKYDYFVRYKRIEEIKANQEEEKCLSNKQDVVLANLLRSENRVKFIQDLIINLFQRKGIQIKVNEYWDDFGIDSLEVLEYFEEIKLIFKDVIEF